MNIDLQMKKWNKTILVFSFLFINNIVFTQNKMLIIGRRTGNLALKKNLELRVFGFSTSLSGNVFLPGPCVDVVVNDTVNIDFWNISQGNPVSLVCKDIPLLQYNENEESLSINQPIDHMEHGYYYFIAKKPGTYLYYSPENYPFNIQAGMFGTIIIRDKPNDSLNLISTNEVLWCSSEIDTKWHTNSMMNVEHDALSKQIILPNYLPNYFMINGNRAKKTRGLQALKNGKKSTPLTLRLVNAGLYHHEIEFPLDMNIQLVFGQPTNLIKSSNSFKVILNHGECIELSVTLKDVNKKERIVYQYIEPESKKIKYKVSIPIFY